MTVSIRFELNPDGTVVGGSLKMISASPGTPEAVRAAFDAGRRAILRCGAGGYGLPPEKYQDWKDATAIFHGDSTQMQ